MKITPMPSLTYRTARAARLLSQFAAIAAIALSLSTGCLFQQTDEEKANPFRLPAPDMTGTDNNDDNNDNNDTEDMDTADMTTPDTDMGGMDMEVDMAPPEPCGGACGPNERCNQDGATEVCECDPAVAVSDGNGGCDCKMGYSRIQNSTGPDEPELCGVALTCKDIAVLRPPDNESGRPPSADGLYPLAYSADEPTVRWLAWCTDLDANSPGSAKTYLPLKNTTGGANTFEVRGDTDFTGIGVENMEEPAPTNRQLIRTTYHMVRIDPENSFRIDVRDRTFSRTVIRRSSTTSTNDPSNLRETLGNDGIDFGTVMTCALGDPAVGNIDLTGTGFKLAQTFKRHGFCNASESTTETEAMGAVFNFKAKAGAVIPSDADLNMMGMTNRPPCTGYAPTAISNSYGTPPQPPEPECNNTPETPVPLESTFAIRLVKDTPPIMGSPMPAFATYNPKTCAEAYNIRAFLGDPVTLVNGDNNSRSFETTLYVDRDGSKSWRATCYIPMGGEEEYPLEYLGLDPENALASEMGANNSFKNIVGTPNQINTKYNQVRIDPHTLAVDIHDTTLIDANNSTQVDIDFVPFGVAERGGNVNMSVEDTVSIVDLTQTSFDITEDEPGAWALSGTCGDDAIPAPVLAQEPGIYNIVITHTEAFNNLQESLILAPLYEAERAPLTCPNDTSFDRGEPIPYNDPTDEDAHYTMFLRHVRTTTAP